MFIRVLLLLIVMGNLGYIVYGSFQQKTIAVGTNCPGIRVSSTYHDPELVRCEQIELHNYR